MVVLLDQAAFPSRQTHNNRWVMRIIQKTGWCILVLGIIGLFCMPVVQAAETQAPGNWSFYIINKIISITDVELNGQGDAEGGTFQQVIVPGSLDHVDVKFVVTGGPDTTVTITKDYIDGLHRESMFYYPTVYAWGGPLSYDVDAGGWGRIHHKGNSYCVLGFTLKEHLVERGLVHLGTRELYNVDRCGVFHERYVTISMGEINNPWFIHPGKLG